MGARSARIFEGGDAARLIGVRAGRRTRVDVRDSIDAAGIGVEIGVEHAGTTAVLDLDAIAFAHLERRAPEMIREVGRAEADEPSRLARHRDGRSGFLGGRLLRPGGAAGEQQGGGEN